jgi:hypothetical protein
MRAKGAETVGRFSVDIEVANNDDLTLVRRGLLQADQVLCRPHSLLSVSTCALAPPAHSAGGSSTPKEFEKFACILRKRGLTSNVACSFAIIGR